MVDNAKPFKLDQQNVDNLNIAPSLSKEYPEKGYNFQDTAFLANQLCQTHDNCAFIDTKEVVLSESYTDMYEYIQNSINGKSNVVTGEIFINKDSEMLMLAPILASAVVSETEKIVCPLNLTYPPKESHAVAFCMNKNNDGTYNAVILEQHAQNKAKDKEEYKPELDYSAEISEILNSISSTFDGLIVNTKYNEKPICREEKVCGIVSMEACKRLLETDNPVALAEEGFSLTADDVEKLHTQNIQNYNREIIYDEETNFIGETKFYDDTGNIIESFNHDGKILVINFPGSGMTFKNKDENEVKEGAKKTCLDTKSLLPQDEQSLSHAFVCTAVYENKADKAIKEYNDENNNTHSAEIFEQVLKPMIVEGDYAKTLNNLSSVIFRGHCFGTMVIAEMEKLLEAKLKEQFNETQCKELLSAPQALISSPSLQLDKYPKYFQTTAIVNNSDRTITNEQYCGNRLRHDLQEISGFQKDDLVSFNARDIFDKKELPQVPDIKISERKKGNVHFFICNRASIPDNYVQLESRIEKRIGLRNEDDKSYETKFMKQLKKNIGGHEYFFLPDELKNKFSASFMEAFNKSQIYNYNRDYVSEDLLSQEIHSFDMVDDNERKVGNVDISIHRKKIVSDDEKQSYPSSWFVENSNQLKPVLSIDGLGLFGYQGAGYGRAALQRAYEMSVEQGCEGRIEVPVTWNAGFYEHCGLVGKEIGKPETKYFEPTPENIEKLYKGGKRENLAFKISEPMDWDNIKLDDLLLQEGDNNVEDKIEDKFDQYGRLLNQNYDPLSSVKEPENLEQDTKQKIHDLRQRIQAKEHDPLEMKQRKLAQGLRDRSFSENDMGKTGDSRTGQVTEKHRAIATSQIEDAKPLIKKHLEQMRSK